MKIICNKCDKPIEININQVSYDKADDFTCPNCKEKFRIQRRGNEIIATEALDFEKAKSMVEEIALVGKTEESVSPYQETKYEEITRPNIWSGSGVKTSLLVSIGVILIFFILLVAIPKPRVFIYKGLVNSYDKIAHVFKKEKFISRFAKKHYEKGVKASAKHDYSFLKTAANEFRKAFDEDNNLTPSLTMLAGTYIQIGSITNDLLLLRKGFKIINGVRENEKGILLAKAEFYTNLARIEYFTSLVHSGSADKSLAREKIDKGLSILNKILEEDNKNYRAYNIIGINSLSFPEKDSKTLVSFNNATQIKPDFIEAHFNLILFYYLKGNFQKSAEQIQRVLKFEPEHNMTKAFIQVIENEKNIKLSLDQYMKKNEAEASKKEYVYSNDFLLSYISSYEVLREVFKEDGDRSN